MFDREPSPTSFWAQLQPAARDAFSAMTGQITWDRGAQIIRQGEAGGAAYLIRSGYVKVLCDTEEGSRVLLSILGPGDLVGQEAVLLGRPHETSAIAASRDGVRAGAITADYFRTFIERNPSAALALSHTMADALRAMSSARVSISTMPPTKRLAAQLLRMCEQMGEPVPGRGAHWIRLPIDVTVGELGTLIGTSETTAQRALRQLRELGLIKFQGRRMLVNGGRRPDDAGDAAHVVRDDTGRQAQRPDEIAQHQAPPETRVSPLPTLNGARR